MVAEKVVVQGEQLLLLPEKAIYWPARAILLIADLHLGKVEHFRKSGIAIPIDAARDNFIILQDLILNHTPDRVIFLGDLFHSTYNSGWEAFNEFVSIHDHVTFELIKGNHDIMHDSQYKRTRMIIHKEELKIGPFCMTHQPENTPGAYNLCGHIHPCYKLRGQGRQYLRLPCFYFGLKMGMLPAFGSFTGMYPVQTQEDDRVYVLADDQIIQVE